MYVLRTVHFYEILRSQLYDENLALDWIILHEKKFSIVDYLRAT